MSVLREHYLMNLAIIISRVIIKSINVSYHNVVQQGHVSASIYLYFATSSSRQLFWTNPQD